MITDGADSPVAAKMLYYLKNPKNHAAWATQQGPFEMVRIEGRGHGMVATQDIKAGQLLVEEVPLLDSELVEGAGEGGRLSSTEEALVDLILGATSRASLVELPPSYEISPDSPVRASGVKRVRDITGAFRKLPAVGNTVD